MKYKDGLSKAGQTGKTIDNKLMSIRDMFKYASGHGLYTCQNANPVDGLFVLTKTERVSKNEPYQPFEKVEIERFFEPSAYLPRMDAPDLFWGPLLGVYTGMRIGEATQIRVEDVKQTDVGVTYIRVPKSKTVAGIRNIPIPQALLDLGFLNYVHEVRETGADWLFPHRPFVNGSYSKRLSETMREYLKEREIKKPNDHKSFHSFRVNVSTDFANRGVSAMQSMKLVGHKAGEGMEVHAGYVRDLPDLKDVIDLLQWPIDLNALRYQGQFMAFIGDKRNWADLKPAKKPRAKSVKT